MAMEIEDIPYTDSTVSQLGTLTKSSWFPTENESPKPTPPSIFNIPMAFLSFLLCPFIGILALIFSIEARIAYKRGRYFEADALCSRSRGTAIYSIAIGIALLVIMGLLLGLGERFDWI